MCVKSVCGVCLPAKGVVSLTCRLPRGMILSVRKCTLGRNLIVDSYEVILDNILPNIRCVFYENVAQCTKSAHMEINQIYISGQ